MASELKLYKKYEAGLRYLLAQSPDSRALVPETEESAWERIGTKNEIEMFRELAKPPEKLNKTRGVGVIAAPPQLVADVITHDYEKWDDNIRGFKTLSEEHDEESGAVAETSWSRYSLGVPMMKDRDFVYCEVRQQAPGGLYIIYGESLSDEEAAQVKDVPAVKGVVRGKMGCSGWVVAPAQGGAASRVTYVSVTNLKGSFPPALVNQFTNDVPQTIHDVRKVVLAKLKSRARLQAAQA
ncbi:hypothetical protein WJX81_002723 [Elliptochloris bilobata]|uniref:START domain-containing protein n=1 Tax=Elliptochloris bilobata TaxID=381761 RepID=A0AAW1RAS7_9CHLO